MNTVAITGADTLVIDNRPITDLADDDVGTLDFAGDIMAVKTGKNGNSLYALNESGKQADLAIRIIRGSGDDKFLLGRLNGLLNNPAGFVLINGVFVKQVGDGLGNIANDTYVMSGGVFVKIPGAKSNVSGDTSQSVVLYHLKFTNAPRVIT